MIDIPTNTASEENDKDTIEFRGTLAIGVGRYGGTIVGTTQTNKSIYWRDGSPPTTREMGFLPGGTYARVAAVSDNGRIAVGSGDTTGGVVRAFYWRKDETPEMEALKIPAGYTSSRAAHSEYTGNIVVGHGVHNGTTKALYWVRNTIYPAQELRAPQESLGCSAIGINGDYGSGSIVVGYCVLSNHRTRAIFWRPRTTFTEAITLEGLEEHSNTLAYAVSGNGNVIVGTSFNPGANIQHAVRWTRNSETNTFNISNLNVNPEPPQNTYAHAYGVSHDGTIIVGGCSFYGHTDYTREAFIWREDATPQVQKLVDITQGYKNSAAYDVVKKTDGTILAVGQSVYRNGSQAAVRWNNLAIDNLNFPS